jgi:hypothetical protein
VKNTIRVSAPFSFKGETFKPTTILDPYSYAFEVMQQSELYFDNATGLAGEYLQDGCFDFQAYITKSEEIELHSQLQQIAKDTLNIDDLTEEPEIKNALIHAYQLGLNSH